MHSHDMLAKVLVSRYAMPLALVLGALLPGCGGGGGQKSKDGGASAVDGRSSSQVTTISVVLTSASMSVGQTQVLSAVAQDQNGAVVSGVTFTWSSSNINVATIADDVVTAVAAGATDITASSGGVTNNAVTLTVLATAAQGFQVVPANIKLNVAAQATLLAVAPPGATTWTSSDASVATVDANGQVTAVGKGSAVIGASSGAATASSSVKVFQTSGANPDLTSEALIAAALASGTIDLEQSLEYRVFALFGDARLPAGYDGAPDAGPDHMLMRDVLAQLPTLSQAAQDLLGPFFLPPIYPQSALSQVGGPQAATPRAHAHAAARPRATSINCNLSASPDFYQHVSVTTSDSKFTINVFWIVLPGAPNVEQTNLANLIASVALEAYDAETGLLGQFPLSDAGFACNGGDAGIDIYLAPIANARLAGQTIPYSGQCANGPSFIELNLYHPIFLVGIVQPERDNRSVVKAAVAHEFLHVLQLAMNRQASCDDTKWFDEATAEWVMDFVEPQFPTDAVGAPGIEDGLEKVGSQRRRSGSFYAQYLYSGHMRSLEKGEPQNFGYADYLFFQYLARAQSPESVRSIYDAMAAGSNSLESIARGIDMTAAWPEFSKTLWNDATNHVLDYWQTADDYDFGLVDIFANSNIFAGAPSDLKPLEIDQMGHAEQTFTLLDNALSRSDSGDYEIPPRSMFYEQLKFTDATVHTAIFTNPIAGDPNNQYMKVWAARKVGGAWQNPEDWTAEPTKAFCLDKKDERLEELLVIVSNSEINPQTEVPYRIPLRAPMQVATTNVGCWNWQGTASLTTQTVDGPVTVQSATATFDQVRSVAAGLPDAGVSLGYVTMGTFTNSSASFSVSGTSATSGCTITGSATAVMQTQANGPFTTTDGNIIVDFGLPDPLHRAVTGSGSTFIPGVAETLACPGQTEVTTVDQSVQWLSLPTAVPPTISADGQSFTGRWERTDGEGDKVSVWDFHAMQEQ